MKLGIGSYTYPLSVALGEQATSRRWRPLDLLERARALGVRVVQFCDNLPLTRASAAELEELEILAQQWKLEIEVGTRGLHDTEGLWQHVQLAQRFRAPFVRVVVDGAGYEPTPAACVARVRELLPHFRAAGLKLALENHDRFSSRTLIQIIEETDADMVGICLDTVNSFGALEGPEVVVNSLAPYTLNLHLKDFRISRVKNQLGLVIRGCPLGQGHLDVEWVLERLRAAGRDVNAIVEHWTWVEDAAQEVCRLEEQWTAASVKHARQWIPD